MAVSFVAKGTGAYSSGSGEYYDLTYPGGIQADDWLLIVDLTNSGSITAAPSATGFSAFGTKNEAGGIGSCQLLSKVASGSESGTLRVSFTAESFRGGNVFVFRGGDTSTPTEDFGWDAGQFSTTTLVDNDVTASGAGMAVNIVCSNNGSLTLGAFTGATGGTWSEAAAEDNLNGLITIGLNVASLTGAGTIGGGSQTISSSNAFVGGFVVKEASAAFVPGFDVTIGA